MEFETDEIKFKQLETYRVACVDHEWYILTNGGVNIGPFESEEIAKKELTMYLSIVSK